MVLRQLGAWLLVVLAGCSGTPRAIRWESGGTETVVHIPRTTALAPVEIEAEEFQRSIQKLALEVRLIGAPRAAVWRTLGLDALSGDYLYLPRDRKLVPLGSDSPLEGVLAEEEVLTNRYMRWCLSAYRVEGDRLGGALVGGRYMDLQGRYMLALALSKSPVLDELQHALGEMVSLRAIMNAALWMVGTLLFLLSMPEPVTKMLAASMAAALVLWVGADTLYNLVTGWFRLMEEVKTATTFEEIRKAGERFGKVMGRDAARALAMLAMAALGQTAHGFAARVQTLPGSAQVSMQAESQGNLPLSMVGEVTVVAVTAEGFSVVLPPGAVAMAARRGGGGRIEQHHIGTISNEKSTLRGGPWTPRLRELFAKGGMGLNDAENKVPILGHKGPHPEEYHRTVFQRLERATKNCRTVDECRARLTRTLDRLAEEIATPGTELNQLITQGKPR